MITDQVTLLNDTVIKCLNKKNEVNIFKAFMDVGIKILDADYGFAWLLKDPRSRNLELVCKSPNLPFTPTARKNGRNLTVIKTREPIFVDDIQNTPDVSYVGKFFRSYAIIPLVHKKLVHGSMVLCFKEQEHFSKNKKALGVLLGNSAAQAITIHRLLKYQQEALVLKEKQHVTEVLLAEEKSKTDFIANITHEIRTPLTIMRGYIYLATKNSTEKNGMAACQDALRVIDNEIVRLSEMFSDLVLVTAGENIRLQFTPVDIKEIIASIEKRLLLYAREKNIKVSTKIKSSNTVITGDKKYLDRLFLNIIRNAITYGGSQIDISISGEGSKVIVAVKDDGIGIVPEDLPKIFERFFRADRSRTRSENRTGLGLSIAQTIAQMHEGHIDVKSTPGKGSTFTVTLPKKLSKTLRA